MKRITIVFILICFAKTSFSQTYHSFPTDSAMWREWAYSADASYVDNWNYQYFIKNDTTISGKTYHKILKTGTFFHSGSPSYGNNYVDFYNGCFREDTTKHILYCPPGDSLEQVLYDFNLNLGDTLSQTYINDSAGVGNWVSSIDSIFVLGQYRKQYHLSIKTPTMAGDSNYVTLIEGVGSTFGLLGNLIPVFESETHLNCYTHNGAVEYPDSTTSSCDPVTIGITERTTGTLFSIFPNPTTGIINIKTSLSEKTEVIISDVLGKTIYQTEFSSQENAINISQFPKGVYFLKAISGNRIGTIQKIILQ